MTKIKKFISLMYDALAIKAVSSIFDNDAHSIVSQKGWEKLESKETIVKK